MRTVWALSVALVAALAGCDARRVAELEVGVSTEADVRARFGAPAAVYTAESGSRTFEYPRQPEGQTNFMITVGADGRLSALRQVLRAETFAEVTPGLDKAQVRRLLGRPARTQVYALKDEEVWDWRFLDGQDSKLFSVTFDRDGRVVTSATLLEPRDNVGS